METISLQPARLRYFLRFSLFILPASFLSLTIRRGGIYSIPEAQTVLIESLIASLAGILIALPLSIFIHFKSLTVLLSEDTLQAPIRKNLSLKSITVPLSDVVLSRTRSKRLVGMEITTKSGYILRISSGFYPRKDIQNLFDEIEQRQALLKERTNDD